MINTRDVIQIISVLLCIAMLYGVWKRGRYYDERARTWYVFIFIPVLTILYYTLVFIDQSIVNFMNSSDVSSFVRLAVLIALVIFVFLSPPAGDKS